MNRFPLVLAAVVLLAMPRPTRADNPNVAGTWEYKQGIETITFLLNPDGTGKIDDEACRYTVADDKIIVTTGGDKVTYSFKLDGDTMVVSGGDLDKPTPFTRKGGAPKKGLGARIKNAGATAKEDRPNPLDVGGAQAGADKPAETPNAEKAATEKTTEKPAAAAAAAGSPVGVWAAEDGDRMEIKADAFVYGPMSLPATITPTVVRISANGQSIEMPYTVTGDAMKITMGGQVLSVKRVGAAAPAPGAPAAGERKSDAAPAKDNAAATAKSIVGNWDSPDGTVVVRADGTTRSGGKEFKYSVDATSITLTDPTTGEWVKIPYKFDGADSLVLGTGPTKTLTRSAGGPAGVWTVTESHVDPTNVMSITQYLSLYPDGTIGFAKTEGGATRTAVSEQLERFSSFKTKAGGAAGRTYGNWKADGDTVTIQWRGAFNNATWQGRVDPRTGKLTIRGAGILNEGDTLAYERQ